MSATMGFVPASAGGAAKWGCRAPCVRTRPASAAQRALTPVSAGAFAVSVRARVAPMKRSARQSSTLRMAANEGPALPDASEVLPEWRHTLKIGVYIGLWYAFNIVYNISNKKVLNAYPYPWFVAWAQLAVGCVYAILMWALKLRKKPEVSRETLKSYVPVALFHDIGHVATVVSLGSVAVSFTHVVKAMEPFVNVLLSAIIMKSVFPLPVYLSLLPVVGGVIMASVSELSFTMLGFIAAMTSNFAFVGRNVYSKIGMSSPSGKNINGVNLFALMSIIATVLLTPFPFIFEGTSFIAGWRVITSGPTATIASAQLFRLLVTSGLFFHLYQEVAFMALNNVHPVTHSVANTVKRVVIIITSIFVFQNPVTRSSAVGSAIAILGVLLYSLTKNYYASKEKKAVSGSG